MIGLPLKPRITLVSGPWASTAARKQLGTAREKAKVCLMGNSQGRDNVKKRAARRKKTERLASAKKSSSGSGKKTAK